MSGRQPFQNISEENKRVVARMLALSKRYQNLTVHAIVGDDGMLTAEHTDDTLYDAWDNGKCFTGTYEQLMDGELCARNYCDDN